MDANYFIAPAVISIGGITYTTLTDIVVNQSVTTGSVSSMFGGQLSAFPTAVENIISFTPHGVMSSGNLTNLFPLLNKAPGGTVFSDQVCTIIDVNGKRGTYYNAAVKVQPYLDLGLDKVGCFGPVTIGALHAKSGADIGKLVQYDTTEFPSWSVLPTTRFSAAPLVSWFDDRTTGHTAAATLTSNGTNVSADDTVTIDGTVYTFKISPTSARQVTRGDTALASLQNLRKAINASGIADVNYGAGTTAHASVTAGMIDPAAPSLKVHAKNPGVAGNSIATSKSASSLSWGSGMAGGTDYSAAKAVGHAGSDKGWLDLATSGGVRITPKQALKAQPHSQYGGIGNYTCTETGVDIDFQPVDLSIAAFDAAQPLTVGAPLTRGDCVVTADGGEGQSLTAWLSQCLFAGGTKTYSASTLFQGAVRLSSSLTAENTALVSQARIKLS
ncbi:MAG: hypothetical protein JWO08_607 [Verrucomicrobiaceae bacterium]|nr:hypothetical protein [Verrucomicrobiaceae bacterium]